MRANPMATTYQPCVSDVADLYWWKSSKTFTSNVAGAAGQSASDQIKIRSDAYFCLVAWRGVSNYDSAVQLRALIGAAAGTATTGIYSPAVPNNFEAQVKRNNRQWMMDAPMPQAALCSSGYRSGQQVPWPILYTPSTMFNYYLYNTAEVMFLNVAGAQIDLRVDFGMFGYNIPAKNVKVFLASWPELYGRAMRELTSIPIPGIAAG